MEHDLGSLAYYYLGTGNTDNVDAISSIILGNSLLTARGIPVAGEYEIKNAQAMKIMDSFGAGGSFTDFASQSGSQTGVCRLSHLLQGSLDARIGDEAEEWGLFQLHGQPLAQRAIKHGVARLVFEIGEDNCVLVSELWRPVEIEITGD